MNNIFISLKTNITSCVSVMTTQPNAEHIAMWIYGIRSVGGTMSANWHNYHRWRPWVLWYPFSTLRPRQNGLHFAYDIFKLILKNENVCIPLTISLNFGHRAPFNNIPDLVHIMDWRRPGDKTSSEPMLVSLPLLNNKSPSKIISTTRACLR